MVHDTLTSLPWFVPGVALAMIVGVVASRRVGMMLEVRRALAWAILVAFGVIVSSTLTPLGGSFDFEAVAIRTCDLSRIGPAPITSLLRLDDTSLNIVLFIPLGIAIGLVRSSGQRAKLLLVSIALPFGIETIQLLAPILDRGCESADIVDNITGLFVGLLVGIGLRSIGIGIRHTKAPSG